MHPAPSLLEAPPEPVHSPQQRLAPIEDGGVGGPAPVNGNGPAEVPPLPPSQQPLPGSPEPRQDIPTRKDTMSSISTTVSGTNSAATTTTETTVPAITMSTEQTTGTPSLGQSIFSVKDGAEISNNRRASRRRTGPLSQQQREKAALIRKLGACSDCRRRRVACHPNHHNMSWEEAKSKYRAHSPTMHDLAPAARPLSPAPSHLNHSRPDGHDPQEMEIDSAPSNAPGRPSISDARIRTPLPSGPRLERPASMSGFEIPSHSQAELQDIASGICKSPYRSRYTEAHALLFYWHGDEGAGVAASIQELADVLKNTYRFTVQLAAIPSSHDRPNPWLWLSTHIGDFMAGDQRNVLKVVYYNGHSYLDENREMVLASSPEKERASTIRWSGIQQCLEEAKTDTLVMMDAAYYPSAKICRKNGTLEFLAAALGEEYLATLGRSTFTRAVTKLLRTRAQQLAFHGPFNVTNLHAKLMSEYSTIVPDVSPEKDVLVNFPSPLHMQVGQVRIPSILLAPIQAAQPRNSIGAEQQVTLTFKLGAEIALENWSEWLATLPQEVKDVKVEGSARLCR